MFIRNSLLSFALLGALGASAFASVATASTANDSQYSASARPLSSQRIGDADIGATIAAPQKQLTRQQVQKELADWRSNPVAGGWRDVGGELGWKRIPHRYEMRSGQFVHSDNLTHDATRPGLATPDEKSRKTQIYGSGS